ncbi:hypothetical protein BO99DRAFT_107905 [Aspergillus violaceofuscus CBS 115571]|uniref:Uncharacterized protein n=1 Tax=Aspergillus violaceofuscus (strain CBS 115571) TaxID=1450538 RepID=A0A2V5HFG9_ASPV1|nr:hypothetical protein BO99DRAFT_107905 [Aspergillus violaceofuscus CBS 115571]
MEVSATEFPRGSLSSRILNRERPGSFPRREPRSAAHVEGWEVRVSMARHWLMAMLSGARPPDATATPWNPHQPRTATKSRRSSCRLATILGKSLSLCHLCHLLRGAVPTTNMTGCFAPHASGGLIDTTRSSMDREIAFWHTYPTEQVCARPRPSKRRPES